ncbi:RNase adapter protein RapZ [Zhongshania aliphaticivorans]|uniref:RNase adapter protein RapZ n=1 Tax=Zhongshania aliphaticivorans TaxID=1470434 RepID=A0A5S9N0U2_9GAMM|nr:RNase adapter RapZ [Zhongshania aliphaticivorans]CAA0083344.1 RNase adapter protein RapZ [Zhongshania aliphaticivorans]CAA0083435.1 RNase adapter protein RapZ [Zhongshania aliphaticivorans]
MELIILSGRSGSGKSTALHQLEDEGYYAIDNLPISLLPELVKELSHSSLKVHQQVAVCIDARNSRAELARFQALCDKVKKHATLRIVFLDAGDDKLIKRFSETRRRHPLTTDSLPLADAIKLETALLEPIVIEASLAIDTSDMTVHELRAAIRDRILGADASKLAVQLKSFGFKRGLPIDADLVYDLRMLPNPHWHEGLRVLTGQDSEVQEYLSKQEDVRLMYNDILQYLQHWLPKIETSNRSYFTIAIGCTGGQHRSVYMTETLAKALRNSYPDLQVRHRELQR